MIFACLIFLAKAIVGVLAAFAMIGTANSVHQKLKDRIVFAGVSCLFLFVFAWLRIGAARQFLGKLRSGAQRRRTSVWEALDLLVIIGGIAVQMFYTWYRSTNTAAGGALEEAFTIFWLWVLYLLCSLVLTPSRMPTGETHATAAEVVIAEPTREREKQIYIVEQIGGHGSAVPRELKRRLAAAASVELSFAGTTPLRGDADVLTVACGTMLQCSELLSTALSSTAPSVLLPGSTFMLMTYAATAWKYVDQQISHDEWCTFRNLHGLSPGQVVSLSMAKGCKAGGARARVFFAIADVLVDGNAVSDQDRVLHAIELMCVRSALADGALLHVPMRVLYASSAEKLSKRALFGKLEHAQKLDVPPSPAPHERRSIKLADRTSAERFAKVCLELEFPRTCQTVYEALTELAAVYNDRYRRSW